MPTWLLSKESYLKVIHFKKKNYVKTIFKSQVMTLQSGSSQTSPKN